MTITVTMSDLLKRLTGQFEPIVMKANTPVECAEMLVSQFPALEKWLFDENRELKSLVWLLVNDERIYKEDFDRVLNDGDQLHLLVAVLGG